MDSEQAELNIPAQISYSHQENEQIQIAHSIYPNQLNNLNHLLAALDNMLEKAGQQHSLKKLKNQFLIVKRNTETILTHTTPYV
ncbi:unnamed protein product (macronuclear) [Paramecium tetraurelia]|uniref:Uncharacterized protein n=1 Tax=Paramecium tetraurelia TaxID=5888 RepID=A0D8V3_PARTE|nr:uncharacterized protein GSPATT00014416001 [Paramecium tetraurelia]CAK79470.1 unnamed protein product [Paramecium tetraurelia]|eukprot:XP_001446867.1 hypothetical protein (macronuclear) [Paramecium tetraurelia strain d4-2]